MGEITRQISYYELGDAEKRCLANLSEVDVERVCREMYGVVREVSITEWDAARVLPVRSDSYRLEVGQTTRGGPIDETKRAAALVPEMSLSEAREIVATVARAARGLDSVSPLVDEMRAKDANGDVVLAGEVARTIDEIAGHWRDGKWIGASKIARALEMTRRHAGG